MDAPVLCSLKRLSPELNTDPYMSRPRFEDVLSNEIWDMVFKYANITQYFVPRSERFSSIARLVSKRFNSALTPIAYRSFKLSPRLIAVQPNWITSHVAANVQAHTREISIKRVLDWDRTVEFLAGCRAFRDLRWSLPEDMDPSLPRPIQMAFRQYWPHVRLHFYQGYNLGGEVIAVNPETIPPLNLSTLTILKCDTLEEAVTPNLNALIASAKRLEILDISLPADYRFSAAYGKLPPVKHLKLYGRSTYNCESIDEIWDFSQLKSLEFHHFNRIVDYTIQPFESLRALTIGAGGHEQGRHEKRAASVRVSRFVQKLENLEDAVIATWYPAEIVKSLSIHGRSLKKLTLTIMKSCAHQPDDPDYHHDQWLRREDVSNLCASCPKLVELHLDLTKSQRKDQDQTFTINRILHSILALASLTRLRKITLQFSFYRARGFYERGLAGEIIEHVTGWKKGTPLREIVIYMVSRGTPRQIEFSGTCICDDSGQLKSYSESVYPDDIQHLLDEEERA